MAKEISKEDLQQALEEEINYFYNVRRGLVIPADSRLRRSPADSLQEKGLMEPDRLMQELDKIAEKKSSLSKRERDFATELFRRACLRYAQKVEQPKEEEPNDE